VFVKLPLRKKKGKRVLEGEAYEAKGYGK